METQDNKASEGAQGGLGWVATRDHTPPAGLLVDTKIDAGGQIRNERTLRLEGNLWFSDDMATYVYYVPTHWRFRK